MKTIADHPHAAENFLRREERVDWHDASLWFVRRKRDHAVAAVKGWEELRSLAAAIKAHTLSRLDDYLVQFEEAATRNGVRVHWAIDAKAHNRIVFDILREHEAKMIVKSKSMLTEECGMSEFLEHRGIEVIDTDLGERIVQLAEEPPSHIVMPAIHKKREEIDQLFQHHLHTQPSGGDPVYLTREARKHLREKFLAADAAITGVNFAVAETGGVVVCTNEGNADMGVHSTPLHIACMGMEKLIPRDEHLGVFLRLLARSATGQPITAYTSYYKSPRPGGAMHIVIVDNGRSKQLRNNEFREALHCIRCGACMNTCPVYRKSGGHSYGFTIPGPIGSILAPGIDPARYRSLPFASTLCGSCSAVCPVKIDIHTLLYKWRQILAGRKRRPTLKKLLMQGVAFVLAHPRAYQMSSSGISTAMRYLPKRFLGSLCSPWTIRREFPQLPECTFSRWYRMNRSR